MRPVVGVICEYDPFHIGHARQFTLIRQQLPDAYIICVMSGCFTQRGMPALFAPAFRAQAALNAGASLVMELPCAFAVREADHRIVVAIPADFKRRLGLQRMRTRWPGTTPPKTATAPPSVARS